jgi:hypothetical protein
MPPEIRAALLLWLSALVAVEAGAGLVPWQPVVRTLAVVVAAYLVIQMTLGRNWARIALTLLFAGVATPLVAAESMRWLADASGFVPVLFAASMIAHVAAVVAALVYMYLPASNRYFRDARVRRAGSRAGRAGGRGAAPSDRRQPVPELR